MQPEIRGVTPISAERKIKNERTSKDGPTNKGELTGREGPTNKNSPTSNDGSTIKNGRTIKDGKPTGQEKATT